MRIVRCDDADVVCADKYFELISERKIKGYLFEEKNYFEKS